MTAADYIIIYGNCQCRELADLLASLPPIAQSFQVEWIANWGNPGIPWEKVKQCKLAIWQVGATSDKLPFESGLPEKHARLTIPALSCEPFWPLGLIGTDSLLDRLKKQNLTPDQIITQYHNTDLNSLTSLDRLWQVYSAKVEALDQRCDIKIYDLVYPKLKEIQMFWIPIHPSHDILLKLASRMLDALGVEIPDQIRAEFLARPLLGGTQVPLHPQVIEHYGIKWADVDTKYVYQDGTGPDRMLTHAEYIALKAHEVLT